ncbi:hypothetical protein SAMN05518856_109274 [Paenibacillus sp. OK003]|nr:hypothetical protein SAMN05518856_109274 [Paenibacillus sp. OK003]
MDWTVSLETALYFACNNVEENKDSVLWLLNPCEFNQFTVKEHAVLGTKGEYLDFLNSQVFKKHEPVAIYPEFIHTNFRAQSQSGYFLYTGDVCDIVSYMDTAPNANKIYRRIVIPYQEALMIRQLNPTNGSDLFLDGLNFTGLRYYDYRLAKGLLNDVERQKEQQRLIDERDARMEGDIERNGG